MAPRRRRLAKLRASPVLEWIAEDDARSDSTSGGDHQYQRMQQLWHEGILRQEAWEWYVQVYARTAQPLSPAPLVGYAALPSTT